MRFLDASRRRGSCTSARDCGQNSEKARVDNAFTHMLPACVHIQRIARGAPVRWPLAAASWARGQDTTRRDRCRRTGTVGLGLRGLEFTTG